MEGQIIMKKLLSVLLLSCFLFSLISCGGQTNTIENTKGNDASSANASSDNSSSANGISKPPRADDEENDDKDDRKSSTSAKQFSFGELLSADFVELSIDGAALANEVFPENPEKYICHSLEDIDGETYIYLYGNIKNVAGEAYDIHNIYASILVDGKYRYDGDIVGDEGGTFSYFSSEIKPLQNEDIVIYFSVPDELTEAFKEAIVTFGFKDDFESEFDMQESDCDYLYSISLVNE